MSITLGLFSGTLQQDPITGRHVSRRCWNTLHQEADDAEPHQQCRETSCDCLCHERPA
jgi:hypothetical protein